MDKTCWNHSKEERNFCTVCEIAGKQAAIDGIRNERDFWKEAASALAVMVIFLTISLTFVVYHSVNRRVEEARIPDSAYVDTAASQLEANPVVK